MCDVFLNRIIFVGFIFYILCNLKVGYLLIFVMLKFFVILWEDMIKLLCYLFYDVRIFCRCFEDEELEWVEMIEDLGWLVDVENGIVIFEVYYFLE